MFNDFIVNLQKAVIEQVAWAERELKGKTGKQKREAVVKKLDDIITLPAYLEWVDDFLIGYLVDKACEMFNSFEVHKSCQN